MKRLEQIVLIASFISFSWLGMQVVHEAGHIAAATLTGTEIIRVVLHPLHISETEVWEPAHPLVVVWSGPLAGTLLPLMALGVARQMKSPGLYLFRFLPGFV